MKPALYEQPLPSQQAAIIATAGHVDHGKTSLVRQLTGKDTDTLAEEKARGLSINPGFAYAQHVVADEAMTLGFVDVPGHADFIANMVSGVGSVRYAMLVIAADDGIMPQTREHLAILQLMGIETGLVVLTKIDRCSAERVAEVRSSITALCKGSFLDSADIIAVSNINGSGIGDVETALLALTQSDSNNSAEDLQKHPRFLVDRSFSTKGLGTIVTGTMIDGNLEATLELRHTRSGEKLRIKNMRLHEVDIQSVGRSQRAALNITLPSRTVWRGDYLTAGPAIVPTRRFDSKIHWLEEHAIKSTAQYHLHIGATHCTAILRCLDTTPPALYQLYCGEPLTVHHGDRFVIRDPSASKTLGGGLVLDNRVPRRGRDSEQRRQWLRAQDNDTEQALGQLIALASSGVDLQLFAANRNLTDSAVQECLDELMAPETSDIILLKSGNNQLALQRGYLDALRTQILDTLATHHSAHPEQQGMSTMSLAGTIAYKGSHGFLQYIIEYLLKHADIIRTGTSLHLPQHQVALGILQEKFFQELEPHLLAAGRVAPRTRELVALTNIPLEKLESSMKELTLSGHLVRVAHNRHYLPQTIIELAEFTESLAAQAEENEGFSVIEFRDATGIGRNLCIDLLEYFDRIGFTRRDGNSRFVRTDKENIFGA